MEVKSPHSQFVSSSSGTSPLELLHILFSISLTPLLVSISLPWIVPPRYTPAALGDNNFRTLVRVIVEYPLIGVLPLLLVTVFAGHDGPNGSHEGFYRHLSYSGPSVLLLIVLSLLVINHSISAPAWGGWLRQEWAKMRSKLIVRNWVKRIRVGVGSKTKERVMTVVPFFTTFRATVTYLTLLAILAVDFNIFPRRFAKTQAFGFSLMDIGTSSFVFANGIVAPEAKRMKSNLKKSLYATIPLFILGLIRLIALKGISYPEVVEEYGTHWNFFFTLAFVKLFSSLLFKLFSPFYCLKLGVFISLAQEIILNYFEYQNSYVLNSSLPRTSLLSANREGISSSFAYLAIYMFSIYIGQLIYFSKPKLLTFSQWAHFSIISALHNVILWAFVAISHSYVNECSRRAGNLTYVLWALATNYTVLWFHLIFYLLAHFLQELGLLHGPLLFQQLFTNEKKKKMRALSEAVHRNKNENTENENNDGFTYATMKDFSPTMIKSSLNENSETNEASIESKMSEIETELERVETQVKGGDFSNVEKIKELESELFSLREKCIEDESIFKMSRDVKDERKNYGFLPDLTQVPVLLESVSYNGLFLFLLANLITGGINSVIEPRYVPNGIGILVLWTYGTVLCCTSCLLFYYKIQIKFW